MKSRSQTTLALLCALMLLPILIGCQTTQTASDVTDALGHASFCDVAKPIYYSKADTPDTIEQIKEHNAVYKSLCMGVV